MRAFPILAAGLVACGGTANRAVDPHIGMTAIPTTEQGKGVPITEGGVYGDRHDPSGWSGTSTLPTAVGGGPATEKPAETKPAETKPADTKPAETAPVEPKPAKTKPGATPAAKPGTPQAPPKPAAPLPPSKDLDTSPPPKDLQF